MEIDTDGDGSTDLVTANTGSDDVSLLFNNGTGSFEAKLKLESAVERVEE